MKSKNPRTTVPRRAKRRGRSNSDSSTKLGSIGENTSQIVRDAASLLDEELTAGIVAARQVQQRFRKERKISSDDFKGALQKFQTDANQVITMLDDQFEQMQSGKNAQLFKSLVSNAHDLLNLAVEFVNTGTDLANQLIQKSPLRKEERRDRRKR